MDYCKRNKKAAGPAVMELANTGNNSQPLATQRSEMVQ